MSDTCRQHDLRIREVVLYSQFAEDNGEFTIQPRTGDVLERDAWCEVCGAEFDTEDGDVFRVRED